MSLDVWLSKGKKVSVGGKELVMMPLPLKRLVGIGDWLTENASQVIKDSLNDARPGDPPSPIALVSQVLMRVSVSQLALVVFSTPKHPDTGEMLNEGISLEFFDEYLDIPTAHLVFKLFVELNDLENLIKNLQSLPVVKKLMEASSLTFGIPFLNSLQQNTDSTQSRLEGSPSLKSTDSFTPATTERPESGETKKPMIQ